MNEVRIGEHFLYVDGHGVSLDSIEKWVETECPLAKMDETHRIVVLLSRALVHYMEKCDEVWNVRA